MNYRGIITQGYHIDAGGQNSIRIISQGYIGVVSAIVGVFNIVSEIAYFQVMQMKNILFGKIQMENILFGKIQTQEVKF